MSRHETEVENFLSRISDNVGWCAFWLFLIWINGCVTPKTAKSQNLLPPPPALPSTLDDSVEEQISTSKLKFQVFLWDYENRRIVDKVKDLPRFRLSREVREFLTKDYSKEVDDETNKEIENLRAIIRDIAIIEIVDDSNIVDQISGICPAYSFRQAKRRTDVIEFGNFATKRLKDGRPDTGIFNNPLYFLKHILYLCRLWTNPDNTTYYSSYEAKISVPTNRYYDSIHLKYYHTKLLPLAFPEPQFSIRQRTSIEFKYDNNNSDPVEFDFSISFNDNGHKQFTYNNVAFLNQSDLGTGILTPKIEERYRLDNFVADEFQYSLKDEIELILDNGATTNVVIRKIYDENRMVCENDNAIFDFELKTLKCKISKKKDNKNYLGLRGDWQEIETYLYRIDMNRKAQ